METTKATTTAATTSAAPADFNPPALQQASFTAFIQMTQDLLRFIVEDVLLPGVRVTEQVMRCARVSHPEPADEKEQAWAHGIGRASVDMVCHLRDWTVTTDVPGSGLGAGFFTKAELLSLYLHLKNRVVEAGRWSEFYVILLDAIQRRVPPNDAGADGGGDDDCKHDAYREAWVFQWRIVREKLKDCIYDYKSNLGGLRVAVGYLLVDGATTIHEEETAFGRNLIIESESRARARPFVAQFRQTGLLSKWRPDPFSLCPELFFDSAHLEANRYIDAAVSPALLDAQYLEQRYSPKLLRALHSLCALSRGETFPHESMRLALLFDAMHELRKPVSAPSSNVRCRGVCRSCGAGEDHSVAEMSFSRWLVNSIAIPGSVSAEAPNTAASQPSTPLMRLADLADAEDDIPEMDERLPTKPAEEDSASTTATSPHPFEGAEDEELLPGMRALSVMMASLTSSSGSDGTYGPPH